MHCMQQIMKVWPLQTKLSTLAWKQNSLLLYHVHAQGVQQSVSVIVITAVIVVIVVDTNIAKSGHLGT